MTRIMLWPSEKHKLEILSVTTMKLRACLFQIRGFLNSDNVRMTQWILEFNSRIHCLFAPLLDLGSDILNWAFCLASILKSFDFGGLQINQNLCLFSTWIPN